MDVIIDALRRIILFLRGPTFRRLVIFALIGLGIYLLRDFMTVLLLTFVFIYIFNSVQNILYRFVRRAIPVKWAAITRTVITALIYLLFLSLLIIIGRIYAPLIVRQLAALVSKSSAYIADLQHNTAPNNLFTRIFSFVSSNVDISKYAASGGNALIGYLANIGTVGMNIFVSLILSLFYMLEKGRIRQFLRRFQSSRIAWAYDDIRFFCVKFTHSFGKVLQTQILISFINAMLSIIMLMVLNFPYVLGLGAMIFILGLVPVAGVFISLVPLSIIAYSIGGLTKVIYILILVAVLHTLESYILNPKLMSQKTKMPVFFTFLVLLLSEHFLGVWGLIVGLPLTMFVLDVLDVIPSEDLDSP